MESVAFAFKPRTGAPPRSGPIADANGALYGTTMEYGKQGWGTAYMIAPVGGVYKAVRLHNFKGGYDDGAEPFAPLLLGASGELFGTTIEGGEVRTCQPPQGCGVVFELTPHANNGYESKVLYRFQGGADADSPSSGLVADASGALYGTTYLGGNAPACPYGCGTVYKLTPSGSGYTESVLYSFQDQDDGEYPVGVTLDAQGAIYGTAGGGVRGNGVVFKLTPSGSSYVESTLYAFRGPRGNDGANPSSAPVAGKAGAFFGTTTSGGSGSCAGPGGCGTVYELIPSGKGYSELVLYSFQGGGSDGQSPWGLNIAAGGALVGTTEVGAGGCFSQGCGIVYELSPSASGYTENILYTFDSGNQALAYPVAGLAVTNNGTKVFGATSEGKAHTYGGLFEIDL